MTAARETQSGRKRAGRPRLHGSSAGLARRNLLVDPAAVEQLRSLYGARSDSEAVRRAIDLALLADEARLVRERVSARGVSGDVYGRPEPLPVYLNPGDLEGIDEDDDSSR